MGTFWFISVLTCSPLFVPDMKIEGSGILSSSYTGSLFDKVESVLTEMSVMSNMCDERLGAW